MDGRERMSWRKSWIDENLIGSIRTDLLPEERSVWNDLLDLCGKSRRWGIIERSKGIPFEADEFAYLFKTPVAIVQSAIDKCLVEGRLQRDDTGALVVAHWDRYQQRPSGNSRHKAEAVTLSAEDQAAKRQAAAARLAYLEPDAARRGLTNRDIDESAKNRKGADNDKDRA